MTADFNNIRDSSRELKKESVSIVQAYNKLDNEYCKLINVVNKSNKVIAQDKNELLKQFENMKTDVLQRVETVEGLKDSVYKTVDLITENQNKINARIDLTMEEFRAQLNEKAQEVSMDRTRLEEKLDGLSKQCYAISNEMSKSMTQQTLTDFFVNKILPMQIQTQTTNLIETLSSSHEQIESLYDLTKATKSRKSLILGQKSLQALMTEISEKRKNLMQQELLPF